MSVMNQGPIFLVFFAGQSELSFYLCDKVGAGFSRVPRKFITLF